MSSYLKAKNAPVGSMIHCPCCNKKIKKLSYQHAFCSNKGSGNCKDTYWNLTIPSRMDRVSNGNDHDEHPFSSDGLGQS